MSEIAAAYVPGDRRTLVHAALLFAIVWAGGFGVSRVGSLRVARAAAWSLVVSAGIAAAALSRAAPPGFRMLAIIGAVFLAMKAPVAVEAHAAGVPRLSLSRWLLFTSFFGMRPAIFAADRRPVGGGGALVARGLAWAAVGAAALASARLVAPPARAPLATPLLLVGTSLVLHFGVLNVSAGGFRLLGFDARQLFPAPLLSQSLAEFWGKRWNLAFSEMTATAVYRPLTPLLGRPTATAIAFLASGLLHEIAISAPVRAGYGLPLLYFLLHGVLLLVERALAARGRPIRGVAGRVWTVAWLAGPMGILFHPPFLRGVLWPLLGVSG